MNIEPTNAGPAEPAVESRQSILIHLNGEERSVPRGTTISTLLTQLELKGDRVAVELDRHIVHQAEWESTALRSGSAVEVVHFVGGG